MKRFLPGALMSVVIMGFGTFELFIPKIQEFAPATTEGGGENIAAFGDSASLALAAATIRWLKIDPKKLSDESMISSAMCSDREKVEVLARSVTFPGVLELGERILIVDYQHAAILCYHVALYAGRVNGLILAMDRDTVLEYELYLIIDAADGLYDSCLGILLVEASDGQTENYINQRNEVKEAIVEQIQMIQIGLRFAQNVRIEAPGEKLG
jgi:hypothetical protein